MRTKFNVILTLMLALVVQLTFAQGKVITGVVTEAGTGDPLPGTNVVIKGSKTGVATDFDGNYSIKVQQGQTLVFSSIGYETVSKVVGSSNTINVAMKTSADALQTVVINALGVEVKKSTEKGIATSKIKARALQTAGETDPVAAMSGKMSGVKINMASGDPGASANIVIRGPKTILLSTQPLFVIDGIPVIDGMGSSSVDGVERPSKIGDIDPNDIASVKVLKGAAAAALWGTDGANGVVLITTKSGKYAKKGSVGVTVRSSISFDNPLTKFPLQDTYGKGIDGAWTDNYYKSGSWGDKIANRAGGDDAVDTSGTYFEDQDGKKWYPILTKNSKKTYNESNRDAVIGQGMQVRTGVQLNAATANAKYFLSVNNLKNDGIFANSFYNRTSINFSNTLKATDKFKITSNFQYTNAKQNAIQKGSNLSGLLLGLYRTPADFDNSGYVGTKYIPGSLTVFGSQRSYRRSIGTNDHQGPGYNNPLFTVYQQENPFKSNHVVAGINLQYEFNDWFTMIARSGLDYASSKGSSYFPVNSGEDAAGSYSSYVSSYYRLNNDLMGQVSRKITDDLHLDALVGLNLTQYKGESLSGYYRDFLLNVATPTADNSVSDSNGPSFGTTITRKMAGYGSATFTYKEMLYATLTGRGTRASTFAGFIFYPSLSLAFDFNKLGALEDVKWLNSGTVRASYAKVGNEPGAYLLDTYFVGAGDGDGWGASWSAGSYDGSIWRSTMNGNKDLKPETTSEMEFGLDLKLFDRMSVSFSYYDSKSEDLILYVPQAASSGYQYKWLNAASMTNKGMELELGFNILKEGALKWNMGMTYSNNDNMVTKLTGTEYIVLNGFTSTSSGVAEGQPFGVLRTGDFKRDANGKLVLDANGFPQNGQLTFAGDPNPDFLAGVHTDFAYKGLKLKVLFDGSFGGKSWDGTEGALTHFGRTTFTANESRISSTDAATMVNYSGNTVASLPYATVDGSDVVVRGNVVDFGGGNVLLDQDWYTNMGGGFGPVGTQFFKDATWAKLREVTLSYKVKADVLKKAKIKSIDFGITGRNLFLWTKDKTWGIDPESNLSGSSKGRGLQYFNHPTTKSFIFSTSINF